MRQMKQLFWADTRDWETLLDQRAAISGTLALSDHTRAAIQRSERR